MSEIPEKCHSSIDDVIGCYRKDVDVSLIRENLKLTVEQRINKLTEYVNFTNQLRDAYVASNGKSRNSSE